MKTYGGDIDAIMCPTNEAVDQLVADTGVTHERARLYLYSRQRAIEALAKVKRADFTLGCIDVTRRGIHSYASFSERVDAGASFSGMTAEPSYRAQRIADCR